MRFYDFDVYNFILITNFQTSMSSLNRDWDNIMLKYIIGLLNFFFNWKCQGVVI